MEPLNNQSLNQLNEKPRQENFIREIVKFTIIALIIVIPIRAYVAQPFIVSGASMDPTFATGQYLIIDQLSYTVHEPERGDVVIFRYPRDTSTFFIKRVIGLPGETVHSEDGAITITSVAHPQGMTLDETYISTEHRTTDTFTMTLGPTEYFVMGDNRAQSSDSRTWGPLESKYIVGTPFIRVVPFNRFGVFPGSIPERQ